MFTRKRKRGRASDDSDEEEEPCELENDSLFVNADNIWDVIEFGFMKGEGGWADLLSLIVRMLRNDFEVCKGRYIEGTRCVSFDSNGRRRSCYRRKYPCAMASRFREKGCFRESVARDPVHAGTGNDV